MQHLDPLSLGPELKPIFPARPAQRKPRLGGLAFAVVGSVLTTLGCSPHNNTITPKKSQKPEKVVPKSTPADKRVKTKLANVTPPKPKELTPEQKELEFKVYQSLSAHAKKIDEKRGAWEILVMEQGLEGGKYNNQLKIDIQQAKLGFEIARFKALRSIIKAPHQCWGRLTHALVKMLKKEKLPEVKKADDLKSFGPPVASDSKDMKAVQLGLYKLLTGDLAAVVASVDEGLSELEKILSLNLSPELRKKMLKHKETMKEARQRYMGLLQNGGLFPAQPTPPKGLDKLLLDHFDTVRDEKGGLPKGNAVRPTGIFFGPRQQAESEEKSETESPKPAEDKPKKETPTPQSRIRPRVS